MSTERFLNIGFAYAGYKLGMGIANKMAERNLRIALQKDFSEAFISLVIEDLKSTGADGGTAIDRQLEKLVYQKLFSSYGEDCADFYLGKAMKSKSMGVSFDYDKEIEHFLALNNNSVKAPYSKILNNYILKRDDSEKQNAPIPNSVRAEDAYFEYLDALNESIRFGRTKYDGIIARKGYVYRDVKYKTEEEAIVAKNAFIQTLNKGLAKTHAMNVITRANNELERVNNLEINYGNLETDGFGRPALYRVDGKEFSTKQKADNYISEIISELQSKIGDARKLFD